MMRTLFTAVCLLIIVSPAVGENLRVLPAKVGGVALKDMMQAYLMREADVAFARREAEYEKIKTPEQVLAYQKRMRDFFVAQLGELPERTPLRPRVVAKQDRDGYRIEKIIYESQPRHFVTAILYLPNTKPPYPGVLVPCGHSLNGKARDMYQRISILLAKNGMAALCYDPIEQGERYQLLDANGKPRIRSCTMGHCLIGVGSILLGRNTATFRVWDGMRGIDYLQSRKEIDPERIGCTGNSGGGLMTSYLMALDSRIKCAAPACYLTNFRRLLVTDGPQDAEQNIHAQITYGMGHADYIMMRAPKPTLMCTATRDHFDISGSWVSFRQAKRLYSRLGFAERVDLIEADEKHNFTKPLRVAAVRWMRRWLLGIDDAITEPDFPISSDEELWCTPRGQVVLLEGARTTYDLNIDLEEQLALQRKKFWQQTGRAKALEAVRRVAGIRKLADLPEPKVENKGTIRRKGYRIKKLVISPEPGVLLPALVFVPEQRGGDAYLYLNAAGKHIDAAPGGAIEKLVKQGHLVMAADPRGLGETQCTRCKYHYSPYIGPEWDDVFLAYMLDKSYVAMRAEDVLVCTRLLAGYQSGEKPNRVHLLSIGLVGPAVLHAAVLEPRLFDSVTLKKCLLSWSDVVHAPLAKNQFVNVVHGALKTYDLPDLLATLPKERLTVINPFNALEQPLQ